MDTITSIPESVVVWKFDGKPGNLTSQNHYSTDNNGNGYNMFCQTNNMFLAWGKQKFGINLKFTTNSAYHKSFFRLPDGSEREILTGEKVAMGIGGGDAMLRYCDREFGINLCWAATDPDFQWRIYGPTGEKGKPIPMNSWVALVNANVKPEADFLINFDRPPGHVDLGWTSSTDWKKTVANWVTEAGKTALMAYLTGA